MKNYRIRLLVITDEHNEIIGTAEIQQEPDGDPYDGHAYKVSSRLVAGPGQCLHEVELEIPENILSLQDIHAFHGLVRQRIIAKATGGAGNTIPATVSNTG